MGGGEQKVPTHNRCHIMFQTNFNSSLLFGIQNIIFKAQNKKRYSKYADLPILLTNVRELWQICGLMICSKLRGWPGLRKARRVLDDWSRRGLGGLEAM